MIEKLIPLQIPPGIVKNGTMYQRMGRWADGNLVRFDRGHPKALGGVTTLGMAVGSSIPATLPWGAYAWYSSSLPKIVVGTGTGGSAALTLLQQATVTTAQTEDITPASISGTNSWHFANLGDVLVACRDAGAIYEWTGTGTNLVQVNASGHYALCVTPENFVMGARIDGTVAWASQGTTSIWTPASSNSAGSLSLNTRGRPRALRKLGKQTLLWTTQELWVLSYIGAPLYYGSSRIADNCGLIAPRAVAIAGETAYWMTNRGFMMLNGYVQPVPCEISDAIFGNMNESLTDQIFAVVNDLHSEIWWFWPSSGGSAADQVAIYNYVDRVWSLGTLTRAAGISSGFWPTGAQSKGPVLFEGGNAHVHEYSTGVLAGAYIESGPFMIEPGGSQLLRVQKLVPDNEQTAATENGTLYAGAFPKAAETSQNFTIPAAGGEIDMRLSGRYVRYKQELTRADSRVGTPRIGVTAEGRR